MAALLRTRRMVRVVGHIVRGLWLAARHLPRNPPPKGEAQWAVVRDWHRRALALMGVQVRRHGELVQGPALLVANHVSWLDISVLSTIVDAGFIGKRELARWPVLGFLIRRGGTIFIERGGRDSSIRVAHEMARRLQRGERVVVFPEGTTTRGTDVRRFHPRLFEAARAAGVPIQPIALAYDNPRAAFVDDEVFLPHLVRVLGEREIGADLFLLAPIHPEGRDRRSLARQAEAAVRNHLTAGQGEAPPRQVAEA